MSKLFCSEGRLSQLLPPTRDAEEAGASAVSGNMPGASFRSELPRATSSTGILWPMLASTGLDEASDMASPMGWTDETAPKLESSSWGPAALLAWPARDWPLACDAPMAAAPVGGG